MAAPASTSKDMLASLVLVAVTVAALVVANSPLAGLYKQALDWPIGFDVGPFDLSDSLKNWIKNALMGVFFLYVGLEIKAEFKEGALSDRSRATLPFTAALGGMIGPALIYLAVVAGDPRYVAGWAIPSATDIAFAVGVIGLIGSRAPPALRAFLMAVAVIDDLGAILIIAFFYTAELHVWALIGSSVIIAALAVLNARHVAAKAPYLALGVALWVFVLQSGVNATLAGVIVAMFIPLKSAGGTTEPLHELVHSLKTPVLFLIMPIFAFANAGVPLLGLAFGDLLKPVTLGVALGLLLGKPVGITLFVYLSVRAGVAQLPDGASWPQIVGVGFIAGIGFTMSLFVGALAFGDGPVMDQVRLGVLLGSLVATLVGAAILIAAAKPRAV